LLELGLARPDLAIPALKRAQYLCTELGLMELAHWNGHLSFAKPTSASAGAPMLNLLPG